MAQIKHFTKDGILKNEFILIDYDGSIGEFIADTYFESGIPFSVFEGEPSAENEITFDEEKLLSGFGSYVLIETPSTGLEPAVWFAIVSLVISVASILLAPNPKLPANISRNQESPNNSLSNRSNQPRPLQRIPDIKGRVVSIPDVIAPTYKTYVGSDVFEHSFFCVGRNEIDVSLIKDGDTPLNLIEGSTAGVFAPNTSPNSGSPVFTVGNYVAEPIVAAYRSNEVDGINLISASSTGATPLTDKDVAGYTIEGASKAFKIGTNILVADLPEDYYVGNSVVVVSSPILFADSLFAPTQNEYFDVSGTHKITAITNSFGVAQIFTDLTFTTPNEWFAVGGNGTDLRDYSMTTKFATPFNTWFYHTKELFDSCLININAQNGIYRDTGAANLLPLSIDYQIEVQGIVEDSGGEWVDDGNPSIITTANLTGQSQAMRGLTVSIPFERQQYFKVRTKRTTPKFTVSGSIVDNTKIADIYAIKNIDQADFGNVTTIQTLTIGNASASAVKERQLNCQATEKLFRYLGSGVFDNELTLNVDADGNSSAVQSFITDSIDPFIGNRTLEEIAADDLLTMEQAIIDYFGSTDQSQFNFTFDSTEITFQEYAQTLFNAINCIAYREGTIISAFFERPQTTPAMLFTHRSKKPDSETYSRKFNKATIPDGVELTYVDSETNKSEIIAIPSTGAVNPKKINIAGIRNYRQALVRANREWNKIQYRKIDCALTVTAEGRFIKPNDLVAIVKGTRTKTYDGEVIGQSGLTLTLSQDVSFIPMDTHSITLKLEDGTTENIVVTAGTNANQVILANPPSEALRTGIDSRRTEFSFGNDARKDAEKYLIQEIDISDRWFVGVKAINYTDSYYQFDRSIFKAFSSAFSAAFD